MAYCNWCGKIADKVNECTNMGNVNHICNECNTHMKNGVCRECGEPLGLNSIKGKCIMCAQTDYFDTRRKQEEVSGGLDSDVINIDNGIQFTEEDFEKWMTFGQGNFSNAKRRDNRHNWIKSKLKDISGWTPELISDCMNDIEKIMDRNFSTLVKNKYSLVYIGENYDVKSIKTCVDKENRVILIKYLK